jgi:hypothetical protein
MRWHMPQRLTVVAALVAAVSVWPSSAHAGTYDVYSCRLPDGSPAETDGWAPFGAVAHDTCWDSGGLGAELPNTALMWNVVSGWRFSAPAHTRITAFTIYRYAEAESVSPWGRDYTSFYDQANPYGLTSQNPDYCFSHFQGCAGAGVLGTPFAADNKVQRGDLDIESLSFEVVCWNFGGGSPIGYCDPGNRTPGRLRIAASRVTLRDSVAPSLASEFQGAPAPGEVISTPFDLTVLADDRGSGIARAWIEVDDAPAVDLPLALGTQCSPPFTRTVPCPLRVTVAARIDPRVLGSGQRTIRLGVADAAGNSAVSRAVELALANETGPGTAEVTSPLSPGVPNGIGAARFVRLKSWFAGRSRRTIRTLPFGRSTVVEGRLTTQADVPIAAATLTVEERVPGAPPGTGRRTSVRTDSAGRFRYRVPAGTSRTIAFGYIAFSNDAGPVAQSSANLRVRAGVTLRTSTRRVRNGTALRFFGHVLGEREARRAIVIIYALSSGRRSRIPVETVRANSRGRFSYTYRFVNIPGPSVYRFEARVPKQTGFPYLEGASSRVTVRGRP